MTAKRTMSPPDSRGFPGLTRVRQTDVIGTGAARYQLPGESCPECDGTESWCYSEMHPTYAKVA